MWLRYLVLKGEIWLAVCGSIDIHLNEWVEFVDHSLADHTPDPKWLIRQSNTLLSLFFVDWTSEKGGWFLKKNVFQALKNSTFF